MVDDRHVAGRVADFPDVVKRAAVGGEIAIDAPDLPTIGRVGDGQIVQQDPSIGDVQGAPQRAGPAFDPHPRTPRRVGKRHVVAVVSVQDLGVELRPAHQSRVVQHVGVGGGAHGNLVDVVEVASSAGRPVDADVRIRPGWLRIVRDALKIDPTQARVQGHRHHVGGSAF